MFARTLVCSTVTLSIALCAAPDQALAQGYALSTSQSSFQSIAASGTSLGLSGSDDGAAAFSAPTSFSYFGSTVSSGTQLYASTNGTLTIGTSYSDYSNATFPTAGGPSQFMAPFWVDLIMTAPGEVYWAQVGSEIVVEWSNVNSYANRGETISFQVRISTTNDVIRYVYGPNTASAVWSPTAIGMENAAETFGAQMACTPSCTVTDVPNGTTLVFTPGTPPAMPDLTFAEVAPLSTTSFAPGDSLTVPFVVENLGQGAVNSTEVVLAFIVPNSTDPADVTAVGNTTLGSISGGGSTSGVVMGTVTVAPGTYDVAILVDATQTSMESSENNNVQALGTVTVTGGGGGVITVTTNEVPGGTVGIPYDVQLQQVGGSLVTWSVAAGSLPAGLNLNASGRLSGTPIESGTAMFVVEARESGLDSGAVQLTINIVNGGTGSITVTPSSLPMASVGVPYSAMLSATGGVSPYAIQVISGRPDWLLVSSNGQMSGTPDAAGQHSLTISVFDSEGADSTAVVSLQVIESGPLTVVGQVAAGVQGRAYSQRVVRGGTPPYTVSVVDGAFPAGMAVDGQGMLVGTPQASGSWQVTLQVSDSASPAGTAAGAVSLSVTELRELQITTAEIVLALRTDLDFPIEVSGGVPPYTWGISQGALQPGLQLSTEGHLIGQIEEVSTATVTFTVADSDGSRTERSIQVVARGYRNTNTGSGSRSDGGCYCLASGSSSGLDLGSAWGLLVAGFFFARRRKTAGSVGRRAAVTPADRDR